MDNYLILEVYHDQSGYSSADGQVPIIRAVCTSLEEAADLIGKRKITEMQSILDDFKRSGTMRTYKQDLFVVKASSNTFVDVMSLPRIPVVQGLLKPELKGQLTAVSQSYNDAANKALTAPSNDKLSVPSGVYESDRKAREFEMMQRLHVKPLWRGNVTAPSTPSNPVTPIKPITNPTVTKTLAYDASPNAGNIPQPALPVTIGQLHSNIAGDMTLAGNPPTFTTSATPSTSAPVPVPGLNPVANQVVSPLTTSVPLAPVVTGGSMGDVVTDSAGSHMAPPVNTASSNVSRVTGI